MFFLKHLFFFKNANIKNKVPIRPSSYYKLLERTSSALQFQTIGDHYVTNRKRFLHVDFFRRAFFGIATKVNGIGLKNSRI